MKRVKLIVAYDGTGYCGWQVQPNEITVEGVLNKHISELTGEDIKVIGASRTDFLQKAGNVIGSAVADEAIRAGVDYLQCNGGEVGGFAVIDLSLIHI